ITDRVTINSPVSPSTSSSYPGSSTTDWSTPRRERSSPLRGPHGKFVSPSSLGGYSSSCSPPDQSYAQRSRGERHTDMAELAKHEANIEHRTQALKREGFWSTKRLTRLTEPPRPKVHWDYLCEEMQWLSADFAQERRWKRGVARKVVRMVMRHHEEVRQKEEKAKRDEHAKIRRVASSIAKEVRAFWSNVEKVVQYKQQSRLEEKRKKALDLQLDFIVGQTEKYSDLLSKSLAPIKPSEIVPVTPKKSLSAGADEDVPASCLFADRDFEPPCEEEDDEETIEVEEQQDGNDAESHQREIELLKEESLVPLDQLLSTLNLPQLYTSHNKLKMAKIVNSANTKTVPEKLNKLPLKFLNLISAPPLQKASRNEEERFLEEEDAEFSANEEDAEDEEDTIAAQEKVEGNVDHAEELDDLAKEVGNMSVEELLEKYKGAYSSDFEVPSASGSKASSDLEVSGDEEEETEEDESDAESNTSSSDSSGDSAEEEEEDSEKDIEESEEEDENDDCGDEGTELLLKEGDNSPPSSSSRPKKEISHIAATAESLQPKGYTLATTKVKTPIPFLLHGTLREYQHIGLDWLVTMYEKKLNGILADEMGLGKTIQTIALLAHLACEKGNWGPHLIIVPTSVMLNWEMELKRWCPGFKILTYFGSQKERKLKRQGWTKPNAFHVCITSYKLVLQDHQAFRRKSWRYLILDEAQNIKNFKSQRWQSLLNFNSHRRLLLTGTPLQNSLMELWSLMHFLMPHVFQSHREFKEWFSNPLTGMIEGSQEYNEGLVKRLHKVLRPFLLRRIKVDVEKQMPKKYEHVVRCRLSKRQRFLYDDFMAQASTRETLASGHFMSVINILMQLRKVCNHPNLFDPRPIQSPFITQPIVFHTASLVQDALEVLPLKRCDLSIFDLIGLESRVSRYQADDFLPRHKVSRQLIQEIVESPEPPPRPKPVRMKVNRMLQPPPKGDNRPVLLMNKPSCAVPPAAQASKPSVTEVTSAPAPSPVVQQGKCQTTVRISTPKPVLTVRAPPSSSTANNPAHPNPTSLPQTGEVVSIAQLASLAGRPVSSCQGSKPVTFQLQGNKLTLSGAQIHQVPAASPRPVQTNSCLFLNVLCLLVAYSKFFKSYFSQLCPLKDFAKIITIYLAIVSVKRTRCLFKLFHDVQMFRCGLITDVMMLTHCHGCTGSVMHLVSAGSSHLSISQSAPVTAQTTANINAAASSTLSINRVPYSAPTQGLVFLNFLGTYTDVRSLMFSLATPSLVSSPGIVKIVVRQTAGKDGGPVPTLAVAPSPRVAPQVSSSPHPHPNTTLVRNTAPIQIVQRTPGPATAHYTIAPPGNPNPTQSQSQLPRPILKVVQPPSNTEQPVVFVVILSSAPSQTPSTSSESSATPQDKSSSETSTASKLRPCTGAKTNAAPRKVPHPPPRSPFYMVRMLYLMIPASTVKRLLIIDTRELIPTPSYNVLIIFRGGTKLGQFYMSFSTADVQRMKKKRNIKITKCQCDAYNILRISRTCLNKTGIHFDFSLSEQQSSLADSLKKQHNSRLDYIFGVNERHCGAKPVYGLEVLDFLTFLPGPCPEPAAQTSQGEWGRSGQSSCLYAQWPNKNNHWFQCTAVKKAIHSIEDRLEQLSDITERFTFVIPPVEAPPISMHCCHPPPSLSHKQATFTSKLTAEVAPLFRSLHHIHCSMRTQFPDLRLIEYDCGKLQTLHTLLRKLKIGGHRVLIFTQMTRMLDVLEQFLNYHGHIYLRLDGNTRVEQRQALMERFNADQRIFCFILSTRSGGVGVNLTGADTVIFYDSDWNPTMDAQAQDRCHRIGQTRDVHIYRLISERTVEENILKKANQKRMLGDMAIEGGNFTTAFFKQQTIRELFDMNDGQKKEMAVELTVPQAEEEEETVNKQSTTILEQALCRAEDEEDIVAASQAKAEQVAELAEFNENIPLDDGGEQEEMEELSKAEQEIAALVEQLTPIERYAMNFLEASLEDVCKEELKQAEEQVEAARKGLDQAKEEGLKLHASSDDDDNDFLSPPASVEPVQPTPARRGRKPKDKNKIVTSTRMSGRLRGASPETEPEPATPSVKRKRGRPPKNPPAVINSDKAVTPPAQPAKPAEEINPAQTPKRKRGRPRSTPLPESVPSKTHSSPAPTTPPPPHKSETPEAPAVATAPLSCAPAASLSTAPAQSTLTSVSPP
uniref:Snf2-related CREBBP activator protein n=1 Tax=Tetraodon nigroviridis TaxID=99883 RepID=H3CXJ7_TETNG